MLFNSFEFLCFLPVVFILYWSIRPLRAQNLFVIAASYVFYGWWDWRFLGLIILATATSFACGYALSKTERATVRRLVCWANIIVSLGILGTYKYYNFFAENFSQLLSLVGIQTGWTTLELVLPVGISFYTFQTLSYTIDVYRRNIEATHDPVAFFAFISFFPQLVAGPIERADNLLPQFQHHRTFDYTKAVDGMRQILWGLFKKIVIADNCGIVVDKIFADYSNYGSLNLLIGAILFSFQIYGDFSGYTDIAIGTARLFGISLRRNFNFPYFSRDIAEFWRRWHISLSTWFRDYVYIPLGGNRKGRNRTIINTIVVFVVSGFWHGADWTFIAWGAFNALLFIPLLITGKSRRYKHTTAGEGRVLPSLREAVLMGITFLLVVIGRVLYRAESIPDAMQYMMQMAVGGGITPLMVGRRTLLYIVFMLVVEWCHRRCQHGLALSGKGITSYRAVRWGIYYLLITLIMFQSGPQEAFIYFRF